MNQPPSCCPIAWDEALEIGIPEIDQQHRVWFRLVNEFCTAACEGRAADVIYAALVEALRYTETHLREEEAYMRAQDYPFIDDHCDQHAVAAEEMHKFTLGEYDEDYLISYFSNFLPNWLQYHINTSDRRMAEWVLQNTQIPPQE